MQNINLIRISHHHVATKSAAIIILIDNLIVTIVSPHNLFLYLLYIKSSDAKASKCHLKFSSKMSIFVKLLYLCSVISLIAIKIKLLNLHSKKYWVVSTQLWVKYGLTQLLG